MHAGDLGALDGMPTEPCGVEVGPDSVGTLSFTSGRWYPSPPCVCVRDDCRRMKAADGFWHACVSTGRCSTGLPKGVRGRHVSLTHFYPWMSLEFGFSANDR
jgi:hypothetical protein